MDGITSLCPRLACRLLLSEEALCAWVGQAAPGDRLVYHQGFLAIDTAADSLFGSISDRQELQRLGDRAWQLAEDGFVHLVQRRVGPADYCYLVVARHRPRGAGGALPAVLEQVGLTDARRSA